MTSWDISRHPEWDMMYAAGLTVREIADICHQNVATVHLHLRVREKYAPGLRANHEATLKERGPDRPSTQWRKSLKEVIGFQTTHGRLPRRDGDEFEQRLCRWLSLQRRAYESGGMSKAKFVLLNSLSGWSINDHQRELDDQWKAKLSELLDFVSKFEAMPRYKHFSTEHEHSLGVWLHYQHQRKSKKTLARWRLNALNETIPGWRSKM